MKIGIFATADKEFGGVYQYVISLVETLHTYKSGNSGDLELLLIIDENCDTFNYFKQKYNIPVILNNRPKKKLMRYIIQTCWLLASQISNLKKISIRVSNLKSIDNAGLDLLIVPYPSLIGYFTNVPYIVVIHDVQHIHLKQYFSLLKRVERWFYYGIPARNAEATICDSEFTGKDISRYYNVPIEKIKILPLFVPKYIRDWKISKDKLIEVKDKYHLPDRFIFYPAQFWGHKNHINLIRAIKRIQERYNEDVNLILSGSQKQNFDKSMEEIKRLKLNEQIRYIGFVDDEDMPYVYNLSTALVYASLFDPNGIPIYEAFFTGSPVVSSNVCALPEQVGDAGLMFDPINVDDMAGKIFTIYTDEKVRDTLVQKGFERLNDLTTEIYAQKWVDIINLTINNITRKSKI